MNARNGEGINAGRRNKERGVGEERERGERESEESEEEERGGWKVAYQNVVGSIEATNILLDMGRQKKWDLVFVAEAWEGRRG